MSAGAWRVLVPIVSLAGLAMCHEVGGGHSIAAAERDAASAPADARPAAEARPPAVNARQAADARLAPPAASALAPAHPVRRLSPAACGQLKGRVERKLAEAQRCKGDRDCTSIVFEYAFRPCGESAKPGPALDKAAADAKAYVVGCQPVLRPVKCAHRITPVCARGRCTLTTPPGE